MSLSIEQRLTLAKQSLEGLTIGDCFGETFFVGFAGFRDKAASIEELIAKRELAITDWFWTDDSQMAFSIFRNLKEFGEIEQYALAQSFADRYETGRGYGSGMHDLMRRIRSGENWKEANSNLFEGQGSWGNGSAMRVSPIGAYFADDLKKASEEAEKSAIVTHTHDEAIDGAKAIAIATALAWQYKQENKKPKRPDFIDEILPFLSDNRVKSRIKIARDLNPNISTQNAADVLGNGIQISCQDTVPFCLFSAVEFIDDYEEALWQTVSVLGDRDTTCAIVGGIVSAYTGTESIPSEWKEKSEPIPNWVLK